MSPATNLAYYVLWFAHPTLEAGVAGAMVWRKLHRTFPLFFTYIVAQVVIFALIFPIHQWGSPTVYFRTYWSTTAVSIILGFRVLHEIFLDIFRPYHALRDLGSLLFKWAGLVMLLVAGVIAASASAGSDPLVQGVLTAQRSMRVVQVGLVFFLLVFSRYLGISWRQRSFGIALGFGGFAAVELLVIAVGASKSIFLTDAHVGLINMGAYNLSLLAWVVYMLAKSPARDQAAHMLRPQRWEDGLNDLQHPHAPESLIPMFEDMVERALSRAHTEVSPRAEHGDSSADESQVSRRGLPRSPQEVR